MVLAKEHDATVDVWSLGVVMYEFLTGSPPFESADYKTTCRNIVGAEFTPPDGASPEAVDLLSKLLVREPSQRIPLSEVKFHPWIVKKRQ